MRHITFACIPLAGLLAGCVPENHPLGTGEIQFLTDDSEIYAADVLDESGRPVLPRQAPFEKNIQIFLTNASASDRGAYVDLQIDPPIALEFVPVDDTCVHLPGVFRCTAEEDGFANFIVRSESDYSGTATIRVVGRGDSDTEPITILPAGLPSDATGFVMTIEGVDDSTVPARFNALECTVNPSPDSTFEKWPVGATRVREAEVRASGPSDAPNVVENAPVIVQSLHPEVFVTLDSSCPEPRTSRLRVQLDELGRSPKFYFCFSDIGGQNVQLSFSSGKIPNVMHPPLEVETEPRLLRVVTLTQQVGVAETTAFAVAATAFNADLKRTKLNIDIESSDTTVFTIDNITQELLSDGDAQRIEITPVAEGTAQLRITPELHASPICLSDPITITP